jgi:hypothetical protein
VEPGAILRCFADLAERGAASVAPVPTLGDGEFEPPDEAARPTRWATAGHPVLDSVAAHRGEPVGRGRESARGGARLGLVRSEGRASGQDDDDEAEEDDGPFGGLPAAAVDLTRSPEAPAWLGTAVRLPLDPEAAVQPSLPRADEVRRLATVDVLRPAPALRLGWVVVTGRPRMGGSEVEVCAPLVSQRVVIERDLARRPNLTIRPVGDLELTPLVTDTARAAPLEENIQFGGSRLDTAGTVTSRDLARLPRLQSWVRDVVAAAGLPPVAELLPPTGDPLAQRSGSRLVAWVGAVLYLAEPDDEVVPPERRAASLRAWAGTRGIAATAFPAAYGLGPPPGLLPPSADPLDTPFALSPGQQAAVAHARKDTLTVVTGPPGSGKTTTAAAVAVDAVSRGGSVLLVTGSATSADRLAAVLATEPGPSPLRVGQAADSATVARATADGVSSAEVRAAEHALAEARAHQALIERSIVQRLEREVRARAASRWDTVLDHLEEVAPRALDGPDPARLAALLRRAQGSDDTDEANRWRAGFAEARLRTLVRADATVPLSEVALAVRAAQDRHAAAELVAAGGTTLARAWADLAAADDDVRAAVAQLAAARADSELRRRRGRSVAERLADLLAAAPHRRRQLLASVDAGSLVATLPLWLGTADEVDDLLPHVAGMFDLVVVDDASHVDQLDGAGALLRGKRAVIVGDPRQVRRVADVDEAELHAAVAEHGLEAQASRLDVRHGSLLDVAAGAVPALWLDEHFASVPHLVGFAAQRFYEGRLAVATRHPSTDDAGAVDVEYVTVVPGIGDPIAREVASAINRVEHLSVLGATDIALMSPFPHVAAGLADAVMQRYDLDDVERLGLRVGTVDDFRATPADHVVVVLGLVPSSPPADRHVVEAPDQFTVMVTRARRRLVVVTALDEPTVSAPAGLVDAFLAYAGRSPVPPAATGVTTPDWVVELVDELRAHGAAAQANYPVGRWVVDLCAGKDGDAVAVEAGVHPDGPEAHVARHRALRRTGWRVVDGYPTRWGNDAARAAFDITESLRR